MTAAGHIVIVGRTVEGGIDNTVAVRKRNPDPRRPRIRTAPVVPADHEVRHPVRKKHWVTAEDVVLLVVHVEGSTICTEQRDLGRNLIEDALCRRDVPQFNVTVRSLEASALSPASSGELPSSTARHAPSDACLG